ncbi:MAG: FliG C-terminal domain-containing protein [Parvularculaceae bacterium]
MTSRALQIARNGPADMAAENQPAPARANRFSEPQKAALIIAALGPEAAGPVIERIGDKHLRAFAEAYAQLESIPRQDLMHVVEEFVSSLNGGVGGDVGGGIEKARELLSQFKDAGEVGRLMDDIDAPGAKTVWERLETADTEAFADYLAKQTPQTIAVILARIDSEKASEVLGALDGELAQDVLFRLSKPANVRREALRVLGDTVESEFLAPLRKKSRAKNPGAMIGNLMNNMSAEKRQSLLDFMSMKTPEILDEVKSHILTFEDLPARIPPNVAPAIIRAVEPEIFLKAVKYGRQNAPETIDFLFENISQRMAQQYQEQVEELKQVTVADAEAAQAAIMSTIRRMVAAGDFELVKIASEEEEDSAVYV